MLMEKEAVDLSTIEHLDHEVPCEIEGSESHAADKLVLCAGCSAGGYMCNKHIGEFIANIILRGIVGGVYQCVACGKVLLKPGDLRFEDIR